MTAHQSLASARTYLAHAYSAVQAQLDGVQEREDGFAVYFTIYSARRRFAVFVKVCEDRAGRVTGSSVISDGEPTC
jgi:hypothetical protein